jgi:hypothetical protein
MQIRTTLTMVVVGAVLVAGCARMQSTASVNQIDVSRDITNTTPVVVGAQPAASPLTAPVAIDTPTPGSDWPFGPEHAEAP